MAVHRVSRTLFWCPSRGLASHKLQPLAEDEGRRTAFAFTTIARTYSTQRDEWRETRTETDIDGINGSDRPPAGLAGTEGTALHALDAVESSRGLSI